MFQRWTDLNAAEWKNVCHLEAITGAINLVPFLFSNHHNLSGSRVPPNEVGFPISNALQWLHLSLGTLRCSHHNGTRAICPLTTLIPCESHNHHGISKHRADFALSDVSLDSFRSTHFSHEDDENLLSFRWERVLSSRCFHCYWWVHTVAMITRFAWHSHIYVYICIYMFN